MKTKSKSAKVASVRYDEPTRKKMGAFMRNHTNIDTKKEFGCSAHFAGALRSTLKIPDFVPDRPKAAAKSKPKAKGKKTADLL